MSYTQSPRGKAIEEVTAELYAKMTKDEQRDLDEICEQAIYSVCDYNSRNGRKSPRAFGKAAARNILYCLSLWCKENSHLTGWERHETASCPNCGSTEVRQRGFFDRGTCTTITETHCADCRYEWEV